METQAPAEQLRLPDQEKKIQDPATGEMIIAIKKPARGIIMVSRSLAKMKGPRGEDRIKRWVKNQEDSLRWTLPRNSCA